MPSGEIISIPVPEIPLTARFFRNKPFPFAQKELEHLCKYSSVFYSKLFPWYSYSVKVLLRDQSAVTIETSNPYLRGFVEEWRRDAGASFPSEAFSSLEADKLAPPPKLKRIGKLMKFLKSTGSLKSSGSLAPSMSEDPRVEEMKAIIAKTLELSSLPTPFGILREPYMILERAFAELCDIKSYVEYYHAHGEDPPRSVEVSDPPFPLIENGTRDLIKDAGSHQMVHVMYYRYLYS